MASTPRPVVKSPAFPQLSSFWKVRGKSSSVKCPEGYFSPDIFIFTFLYLHYSDRKGFIGGTAGSHFSCPWKPQDYGK